MKTWQKWAVAAGIVSVIGAGAAYAATEGRAAFMHNRITAKVTEAEDAIAATPQQRQVIDAAKENIIATLQKRLGEHKGDHQQWVALLTADKLSAQQIVDQASKQADAIRAAAAELAPEIVKVHDALSATQRQQLAEKLHSMHQGRWGHGHGGPDGGGFGGPDESKQ